MSSYTTIVVVRVSDSGNVSIWKSPPSNRATEVMREPRPTFHQKLGEALLKVVAKPNE